MSLHSALGAIARMRERDLSERFLMVCGSWAGVEVEPVSVSPSWRGLAGRAGTWLKDGQVVAWAGGTQA